MSGRPLGMMGLAENRNGSVDAGPFLCVGLSHCVGLSQCGSPTL